MDVELKHIKGGLLEQDYSCHPDDFPDLAALAAADGWAYRSPIDIHLRFAQSGRTVEVDGNLRGTIDLTCGRCLKKYVYQVAEDFALTFVPLGDEADPVPERELELDELGLIPYVEERLELLLPVQEQLIMAVPMHTLCSDACQGLCPQCGVDLNETTCTCEKKVFNSKFGALMQLKGKSE